MADFQLDETVVQIENIPRLDDLRQTVERNRCPVLVSGYLICGQGEEFPGPECDRLISDLAYAHFRAWKVCHYGYPFTYCFGCIAKFGDHFGMAGKVSMRKIKPGDRHASLYHLFHDLLCTGCRTYCADYLRFVTGKFHDNSWARILGNSLPRGAPVLVRYEYPSAL